MANMEWEWGGVEWKWSGSGRGQGGDCSDVGSSVVSFWKGTVLQVQGRKKASSLLSLSVPDVVGSGSLDSIRCTAAAWSKQVG